MSSKVARLAVSLSCIALSIPIAGGSAQSQDPALYQALEYRFLGPYRGGRSSAVVGVPDRPFTFYLGSAGGLFKTTNAGESWHNISDEFFEVSSIGAIAVADSDPNVIYAGTGQATLRSNVSIGRGVYKSLDGGDTWQPIGLREAGQIARIRIDPRDEDRVYVGVVGNPFAPSPMRGVFRSLDGGASWEHVLAFDDDTGVADLAIDASNPRILYAAAWTVERKPWTIRSGGEDDGLYKSTDGGSTWKKLSGGLPEGLVGKIGIAVAPGGRRLYALVEAAPEDAGLYRSDDAGSSWQKIDSNVGRGLITRSWYYTHIHADPVDENRVYVLNVDSYVSTDGGRSFEDLDPPHGDSHDLWINPKHPELVAIANDGGVQISVDRAQSWSSYHTQPTAEIYNVFVDDIFPYGVYGPQQDNSAIRLPSRFLGALSPEAYWQDVGGCESAHIAFDPKKPTVFYAGCYAGEITRFDRETGDYQQILLYPQMEFARAPRDLRYRFNWNAPIRMSPHDSSVVYHASQFVHRTTDGGRSWQTISPDLTTNDLETQDYSGYPITRENTGAEVYNTIFAFEESPLEKGLLWTGSDDGRVHVSRDGGESWSECTPEGLPAKGTVNMIELSSHSPGRALITVKRFMLDDWAPYVYLTDDYGENWRLLTDGTNGIPADTPVRVVREDPDVHGLLYAGSEFGMFVSFDEGVSWQTLQLDLPPVPVTDLRVHHQDLVVATQGRGFYILDDLTPLHHVAEAARATASEVPFLYPIRDTIRIVMEGGSGPQYRRGENPPDGVVFFYTLPEALEVPARDVAGKEEAWDGRGPELVLEILDQSGQSIRRFSSHRDLDANPENIYFASRGDVRLPAAAGMNRFVWNFRYPPVDVPDEIYVYGLTHGPRAIPGSYRARLTLADETAEQPFRIIGDPRLDVPSEDFERQLETSLVLYRDLSRVYDAVRALGSIRDQVEGLTGRLREEQAAGLKQAEDALLGAVAELEPELTQPLNDVGDDTENFVQGIDGDLAYLFSIVDDADQGPTEGQVERTQDLHVEVDRLMMRFRELIEVEVADFERRLREANVPLVQLPE